MNPGEALHFCIGTTASFWKAQKLLRQGLLFHFARTLDSTESESPQKCFFLSVPHLPLDFLRDLLDSQFVILRQELQLLVNKSQPLLPLFTHFQAVNPEEEHWLQDPGPHPTKQRGKTGHQKACVGPHCDPGRGEARGALAVPCTHPEVCSPPPRV